TGGRHERHREADAARPAEEHQCRRRHHPADRTRREARDGPVRPRDRARLRQGDRRRRAGRRPARSGGGGSLPRRLGHPRGLALPAPDLTVPNRTSNTMPDTVLSSQGLQVAYGGIQAVKGVDLEVFEGELVALIGAKGAGKTSTLKAVTGTLPWAAG